MSQISHNKLCQAWQIIGRKADTNAEECHEVIKIQLLPQHVEQSQWLCFLAECWSQLASLCQSMQVWNHLNTKLHWRAINQSKPMTGRGVVGVPRQMPQLWWSPIDTCPLQCRAHIDWPIHPWCCPSTIYAVYLSDAFRPRSPVVWSSTAYHGNRHCRTMITCDAWRLTAEALRSG